MITIRPDQMHVFGELDRSTFLRRVVAYLRRMHGDTLAHLPDEALRASAESQVRSALAYGISTEAPVVQFVELGLCYGADFHSSLEFPEAEPILMSRADPVSKARDLTAAAQASRGLRQELPLTLDPQGASRAFSPLQPLDDVVQSNKSTVPACCLATRVRLWAGRSEERHYQLHLPLEGHAPNETPSFPPLNLRQQVMASKLPPPFIQVLEGPEDGADPQARLILVAEGPPDCPPGQPNELKVAAPGMPPLTGKIPFDGLRVNLHSGQPFLRLKKDGARFLETFHPFLTSALAPKTWTITVPGCRSVGLTASVGVFPDVRWEGKLKARTEPDPKSDTGYRKAVEGTLACTYGEDRWEPAQWEAAVLLCPFLGCLEMLARTAGSLAQARGNWRDRGLDNSRLVRRGELTWASWPACELAVESQLYERPEVGLLGHRLKFGLTAEPLLSGSGETSLLPYWLENPLWPGRLAPFLATLKGRETYELAQELGIWLVVEGSLALSLGVESDLPEVPRAVRAEAKGKVRVQLEARSALDYETMILRAGSAEAATRPAEICLGVQAPPEHARVEPGEDSVKARASFEGLALWGVEKRRPGIILRRRVAAKVPAAGAPPAPPVCSLLNSRVWPAQADREPVEVPWTPK
jgi:hypothetical protein